MAGKSIRVYDLAREVKQDTKRVMRQTLEMRKLADAVDGDNNGFVNIPLAARDIQAVVYMREVGDKQYRASLRSKGIINVAKVAEKFGGGGHKNASGLSIEGDWDEAEARIVAALAEAIDATQ